MMKSNILNLTRIFACFFLGIFMMTAFTFPEQAQNLEPLLEKISQKVAAYPVYKSWKAEVVSREIKMDKDWKPLEWTEVTKNVTVLDDRREEEILKALKTKKGETTDITERYIKEEMKRREKARKKEAQRRAQEKKSEDKQEFKFSLAEMFPFGAKKRILYDFTLLEEAALNGRRALVIEARLKEEFKTPKKEDKESQSGRMTGDEEREDVLWDGQYLVDAESYDILRLEVEPVKKQKLIKKFKMEIDFRVLEKGYLVFIKTKATFEASFLIKHIRMVAEEEYQNFTILDSRQ
ncbi:MAG: hypothetical protein WCC06_05410 [Candidatus Aminicenantales bacterium]